MLFQKSLVDLHVAFTGKLASLTRSQAAELVQSHGGLFQMEVTRKTDILVVGQEGWPLQKDGRLSNKLEKAQQLHAKSKKPLVLSEDEWLERLGLDKPSEEIHTHFSLPRLCRLLKIPSARLKAWIRWGLIEPVETQQGVPFFDFRQVTGAKTLWELAQAGVPMEQMRRSLEQLAVWLPSLGHSLEQLQLLERGGRILWRLDEGGMVEPSGQLQLDFAEQEDEQEPTTQEGPAALTAEQWFREGIALEEHGELDRAVHAYRQALFLGGPRADVCFNLANILYAQGKLGQAAERYRQAVELDRSLPEAWNNLGNVLLELGDPEDALQAYREALRVDPGYAEAHYNLADALHTSGMTEAARKHWQAYLRLEHTGEWADYARRAMGS